MYFVLCALIPTWAGLQLLLSSRQPRPTHLQIERLRFMTYALISALLLPTSKLETRCSIQALLLLFFPVQRLVLLTSSSQHSLSPHSRKRYFHHTSLQIASPVCNPSVLTPSHTCPLLSTPLSLFLYCKSR